MFRTIPVRQVSLSRALATHAAVNAVPTSPRPSIRHDWRQEEIQSIYETPLMELVFRAASVHRLHQDPSKIQLCTLMNIKSKLIGSPLSPPIAVTDQPRITAGGCTEDCTTFLSPFTPLKCLNGPPRLVLFPVISILNPNKGIPIGRSRAGSRSSPEGKGERKYQILHGCGMERSSWSQIQL